MFNRPKDPLKEYMAARAASEAALASSSGKKPPGIWSYLDSHYELLHHIWTFSIAFAVTCFALYPFTDWKHYAAVPIVTLFMGPVIAIAELPAMLLLSTVLAVVKVTWTRLRRN